MQSSDLHKECIQWPFSMSIKCESYLNLPERGMQPRFSAQNPKP